MPGLFGSFTLAPGAGMEFQAASDLLPEMAQRMSHQGSEPVDTWTDRAHGLSIARIRLASLAAPPWPGGADDPESKRRVFLDGAVRGDAALQRRDLERRGAPALAEIEGSYTAGLWEPAHQRLTLAVDPRASRPIVYATVRGTLFFAPEVKALLAVPGICRDLDPAAIGIFLGAGYLLSHQTLFTAVRRLAGGQRLIAEAGSLGAGALRIEGEDRYRLCASGDGTKDRDLEEELSSLVHGAVTRSAEGPGTVVFLSGGVDSRVIASEAQRAARARGLRIRTVSWGAPERRPDSDVEVAALVARALGTLHRRLDREIAAYRRTFLETSYLLDGLTDIAAYHPHEHALMRALDREGARVVLRGDECFGYESHVGSIEDALVTVGLRRLAPLTSLARFVRPRSLGGFCEATAATLDALVDSLHGAHPDDAKDLLYFRHRLQGYLGSAAYLKQVVLEHRTPLLDERILAFNARIPARLRAGKSLFVRAAKRLDPELFAIPLATRNNLEDWGHLLVGATPVRAHAAVELADRESGIWEHIDREALAAALTPDEGAPSAVMAGALERRIRRLGHTLLRAAPPVERRLVACIQRRTIRFDQICLRALVLKSFHDLFVTGDGSRRALQAQLERG